MRLGEILALRWERVDLDGKVIRVREALEQTKAHGICSKAVKSRRDITVRDGVFDALRVYRRDQLELPIQLGMGRLPDDALLLTDLDGKARSL
jgi:integrase